MNAPTWLWVTVVLAPIPHAIALFRARFAPCMSGQPQLVPTHTVCSCRPICLCRRLEDHDATWCQTRRNSCCLP
jgi:hypothetical protein